MLAPRVEVPHVLHSCMIAVSSFRKIPFLLSLRSAIWSKPSFKRLNFALIACSISLVSCHSDILSEIPTEGTNCSVFRSPSCLTL